MSAAEVVPLVDPYTVGVGGTVPVRALVGGTRLAHGRLRAGGTIGTSSVSIPVQDLTTDAEGRAQVRLTHDGHWFVAFVHMVEGDSGVLAAAPGALAPVFEPSWRKLTWETGAIAWLYSAGEPESLRGPRYMTRKFLNCHGSFVSRSSGNGWLRPGSGVQLL